LASAGPNGLWRACAGPPRLLSGGHCACQFDERCTLAPALADAPLLAGQPRSNARRHCARIVATNGGALVPTHAAAPGVGSRTERARARRQLAQGASLHEVRELT
jgi:hypothetical protein